MLPVLDFGRAVVVGGTPSTQAFGDAAADGGSTAAADLLHKHGMPTSPALKTTTVRATRAAASGAGSQAVTGAGFAPKGVLVYAFTDNANNASWGFADDLASEQCVFKRADLNTFLDGSSEVITVRNASDGYLATTVSLDADGCTFSFSVIGSGLAIVFYCYFIG